MKVTRPFFVIGILVAAQAVAGCARSSSPIVPGDLAADSSARHGSWIDHAAAHGPLLYVSDVPTGTVWIYSYPRLKVVGEIGDISSPEGLCVDPRTASVWIVSGPFADQVTEFPHGALEPVRTLKIGYPFIDACAAGANGDVAVASTNDSSDPGALIIFKNAIGRPKYYDTPKMFYYYFAAYDSAGDAFVDGGGFGPIVKLAELPAGGDQLEKITPKELRIRTAGGVQYDGTDLAIGDVKTGLIDRISGGAVVGRVKLLGICRMRQFFINAGKLIAPNSCQSKGEVLVYNYPSGGAPIAKITGLGAPFGAVVSR
jgi:hypothetical protein